VALFTGCVRLVEIRLCGGEREREMKPIDQGLAQIRSRDASTLGIVCRRRMWCGNMPIEGFPGPSYLDTKRDDLP